MTVNATGHQSDTAVSCGMDVAASSTTAASSFGGIVMRILRNNGLTIVLMLLFFGTWVAQAVTGFKEHNQEQREHAQPEIDFGKYLVSGHFWEATAENWESEFLQMAMFLILTACFFQKGSPES